MNSNEKNIKKLGFGLMRLPMIDSKVDIAQTKQMVDAFLESGYTYFDTAYPYIGGLSEKAVKEAIVNRHPRASFQLASKMPIWEVKENADLERLFQIQLERTGAGYFDFYMLHALGKDKLPDLEKLGMWTYIQELKQRGLAKQVGFSFHDSAEVLEEILTTHPEVDFVQLQINYADWDDNGVQSGACYEIARKHGVPVIIMEPIKGGSLAAMSPEIQQLMKAARPDLSVASWAMRFAGSLEGVITVLSGMSNVEQMQDNLSYMDPVEPLTDSERLVLENVKVKLAEIPTIPCTDCKYCVPDCPQKINIPGIFEARNNLSRYQNLEGTRGHYNWVTESSGKASSCIACGVCEGHCPQHISIIKELAEIATVLE